MSINHLGIKDEESEVL